MPTGFSIGPLFIHFYGIIIMLGALAAAFLAAHLARRKGENPEIIWDVMPWALIGGIVGARLWHILTPPPSFVAQGITTMYYLTHPLDAIATWRGGVGIPGAVIGGLLAVYLYARKHKLSLGMLVDFIAPGLALAQAIGRWGNFVNQEVFGAPTNMPWKIFIDEAYRLPEYKDVAYYHPLFLYESLWNLMNMGILLWIGKRFADRLKAGDIFLTYLIIYPVGRFLLEFLRLDSSQVAGLNVNQTLMGVIAICAAAALFLRHRFGKPERSSSDTETTPEAETKDQTTIAETGQTD